MREPGSAVVGGLKLLGLVIAGALLLMLAAVVFIGAFVLVSGWLGLRHALGVDTQTSPEYAFASGVGPMLIAALGFSGVGLAAWRHLNCEHDPCWRFGHRHPDHGRPVCRKHYREDIAP